MQTEDYILDAIESVLNRDDSIDTFGYAVTDYARFLAGVTPDNIIELKETAN